MRRYIARPPLAQDRLQRYADGRLRLGFKAAWKDGTHAVLLDPLDFIARLCALVPPKPVSGLHVPPRGQPPLQRQSLGEHALQIGLPVVSKVQVPVHGVMRGSQREMHIPEKQRTPGPRGWPRYRRLGEVDR